MATCISLVAIIGGFGCDSSNAVKHFSNQSGVSSIEEVSTVTTGTGAVVPEGPAKRWSSDGTLLLQGQFDHGLRDGIWLYYDEAGQLVTTETWDKGNLLAYTGTSVTEYGGFGFFGQRDDWPLKWDGSILTLTVYYKPARQGSDIKGVAEREQIRDKVFTIARSVLSEPKNEDLSKNDVASGISNKVSYATRQEKDLCDVLKVVMRATRGGDK